MSTPLQSLIAEARELLREADAAEIDPAMLSAFAEFLKAAELAHETYRKRLNPDGAPDKLGYTKGGRYWRIFVSRGGKEDQRSAYGFFEPATGNLYKSDGWKRPAKGVRASVLDKSTWNRADFSGIR